jgi:hypothetical protein
MSTMSIFFNYRYRDGREVEERRADGEEEGGNRNIYVEIERGTWHTLMAHCRRRNDEFQYATYCVGTS